MNQMIDLQLNYPILREQEEQFAGLLREVSAAEPCQVMESGPCEGSDEHRRIAAAWLSRDGNVVPKERVLLCVGGHHAVMVSLLALGLSGKTIAVDPLTYGHFKTQAASLGIRLSPCAGDEQGMKPGELASAAESQGLKAVYLMPTVHNPLGTVMPEGRRREICKVAQDHDLLILDDDAYNFMEAHAPPSFALLAPERGFSVWSMTKPIAPSIKLAFLTFPEAYAEKLTSMIRITSSGASAILAAMAAKLIERGAMASLLTAKREDAAQRQQLARSILAGLNLQGHPTSYHLWIDLPENQPANTIADQLRSDGILVSSSDAYRATAEVKVNGLRLALGGVRSRDTLREALAQVRDRVRA